MTIKRFSREEILKNVARYRGLRGSSEAYVDVRLPHCNRKKFNVVGLGVTENETHPDLAPAIAMQAVGFSVGMIECEYDNGTPPHSHQTEEFFMALVGKWRVFWLDGEKEEHLDLEPFDSVMWPIGCYRWFRYIGEGKGRLLTIIGGPEPGKVDYLPGLVDEAAKTGIRRNSDGTITVVS
jgi:mannose-6-phosphate isomerase-like protein (cupin superfamily)